MKKHGIPRKPVIRIMKSAMPIKRQLSDQAVDVILEFLKAEVQYIMKEGEKELQRFNGNSNTSKENKRINGFIIQRVIEQGRMMVKDKM